MHYKILKIKYCANGSNHVILIYLKYIDNHGVCICFRCSSSSVYSCFMTASLKTTP